MFKLEKINALHGKTDTPQILTQPKAKPTASSFAEYVFWCNKTKINRKREDSTAIQARMKTGRNAHLSINELTTTLGYKKAFGNIGPSEWELIFVDNGEMKGKSFANSQLTLNSEALACIPDVVLRYANTNNYLVLENKTTNVPAHLIPEQGWPNVQAQLWVYSWIDALLSADRVYLAPIYWTWDNQNNIVPIKDASHLFPVIERGDTEHESTYRELFKRWGGEVHL